MTNWRRTIAVGAHAAEVRFDRFRFGLKRRLGLLDPFQILPYRGYGTPRELFLKGRVLEVTGITRAGQNDAPWENLRNMARRFASDEVAGLPFVLIGDSGRRTRRSTTRRCASTWDESARSTSGTSRPPNATRR